MTSRIHEMSSEEFRSHLYRSLQGRGILDSLKSQLRNRLATELHKSIKGTAFGSSPDKGFQMNKTMRAKIADSIIAEYLQSAGHEYSLSIFLPEAGVSMEKLFSKEDLLHFLRISQSSKLCQHLQSTKDNFLEGLLQALIESHDVNTTISLENQPPKPSSPSQRAFSPIITFADQLEALDQSYARKAEEATVKNQLSLEDRLTAFQRDLEARYKRQLETEMADYRRRELAKVRQEEMDKHRAEMNKEREELHRNHQLRLEEARKSEQQMMERYHMKEKELEAGMYSQRQTLLDELNALRVKESGLKRQAELDKRAIALEKEHMKTMTEQLEAREKGLQQIKTNLERKAEEKIQTGKVEYELQLQAKYSEVKHWEDTISLLKLENKKLVDELNQEKVTVEDFRAQLHEAIGKQVVLQKQKDEIQAKMMQFGDYHQLKHKVTSLQQQLHLSESKCSELKANYKQQKQTNKQLLSHPCMEQVEMDRLQRTQHHKEMLLLQYDNKQLRKQLAHHAETVFQYQKKLDEQLVQLRSAQREVQDLHSLLERADLQGLHKKGGRLGKSQHSQDKPRPVKSSIQQHQVQDHPQSPTSCLTSPFREDTLTFDLTLPDPKRCVNFFDASGLFLAESRAMIDRMEKEAELLEKNYTKFSSQGLNATQDNTKHALLSPPGTLNLSPTFDDSAEILPIYHDNYKPITHYMEPLVPSTDFHIKESPLVGSYQPSTLPPPWLGQTPPQNDLPKPSLHSAAVSSPLHSAAVSSPLHSAAVSPLLHSAAVSSPLHSAAMSPPLHSAAVSPLLHSAAVSSPLHSAGVTVPSLHTASALIPPASQPVVSSSPPVITAVATPSVSTAPVPSMVTPSTEVSTINNPPAPEQPKPITSLDSWWVTSESVSPVSDVKTMSMFTQSAVHGIPDGKDDKMAWKTTGVAVFSQPVSHVGTPNTANEGLSKDANQGGLMGEVKIDEGLGRQPNANGAADTKSRRRSSNQTTDMKMEHQPDDDDSADTKSRRGSSIQTTDMKTEHRPDDDDSAESRRGSSIQTTDMKVEHRPVDDDNSADIKSRRGSSIQTTDNEMAHHPDNESVEIPDNDSLKVESENVQKTDLKDSDGDEGIDPVMLQYMQLVKERRESNIKHSQPQADEKSTSYNLDIKENEVPLLSQESVHSIGDYSNHEDNLFDDW